MRWGYANVSLHRKAWQGTRHSMTKRMRTLELGRVAFSKIGIKAARSETCQEEKRWSGRTRAGGGM